MDYVTQLIETYPERVFRGVVLLLFTICLLAVMAIIRIPSSISSLNSNMKRLMRVLIRIQTGEPVRSVDAFLWKKNKEDKKADKKERYHSHGGSDFRMKWVDEKYLDEKAWLERERQTERFQHSDKPAKERWNERVQRNRAYRNDQDVEEEAENEKPEPKKRIIKRSKL